jgi:hypothetical protein
MGTARALFFHRTHQIPQASFALSTILRGETEKAFFAFGPDAFAAFSFAQRVISAVSSRRLYFSSSGRSSLRPETPFAAKKETLFAR